MAAAGEGPAVTTAPAAGKAGTAGKHRVAMAFRPERMGLKRQDARRGNACGGEPGAEGAHKEKAEEGNPGHRKERQTIAHAGGGARPHSGDYGHHGEWHGSSAEEFSRTCCGKCAYFHRVWRTSVWACGNSQSRNYRFPVDYGGTCHCFEHSRA